MKILMIVLGVVLVLGAIGVGGAIYIGYKAKQKLAQIRDQFGDDRPVRFGVSAGSLKFTAPKGSGCPLLSGEEASQVLGVQVERVEQSNQGGSETCNYWVSIEDRKRIAQSQIVGGVSGISAAGNNEQKSTAEVEKLITGALNAAANYSKDADNDFSFSLEIHRTDGKQAWDNFEKAQTAFKSASGFGLREPGGLGDKAYVVPGGESVMVLKGDTTMLLSFRSFAPGQDKAVELAKQAVGRL